MFQKTFSRANPDFKLNMAGSSSDALKIDVFVRANNTDVEVLVDCNFEIEHLSWLLCSR
jgi:hypothetical protein